MSTDDSRRFVASSAYPDGGGREARRRRLLALLEQGGSDVDGAEADSRPSRRSSGWQRRLRGLCALAVSEVGVDGAGITVMGGLDAGRAGARDQVAAAGALARHLEDLQLTAGEGPCLDAYASGTPVLVADLATETARWPAFGSEALAAGVAAVFSLPLHVGAVRLGTLDLHRERPGSLSPGSYADADAVTLATLATETLLDLADEARRGEAVAGDVGGWLPDVHANVHMASGMVSARAGIDIRGALMHIRAHAFASGEPISEVARRLVARDLVLDTPLLDHPENDP